MACAASDVVATGADVGVAVGSGELTARHPTLSNKIKQPNRLNNMSTLRSCFNIRFSFPLHDLTLKIGRKPTAPRPHPYSATPFLPPIHFTRLLIIF
jgi:hypothetical protein